MLNAAAVALIRFTFLLKELKNKFIIVLNEYSTSIA
jgi:hypothetical protein